MKKIFALALLAFILPLISFAQEKTLPQNFLFEDSDIIVKAEDTSAVSRGETKDSAAQALNAAKELLNQKPIKIRKKTFAGIKNHVPGFDEKKYNLQEAPFGLTWGASITDTRYQGVQLSPVEMKDYTNSFLAEHMPKPIEFFDRVYVVFGDENELYRILAYSRLIDDDASASQAVYQYKTYSVLLSKKYGNRQENFSPALVDKTVTDSYGRSQTIQEEAPIGNPDFLNQLQSGAAVLFSTYNNDDVAAALSVGVDGDKKSYIVIDYKNLKIFKKQESDTLDAL